MLEEALVDNAALPYEYTSKFTEPPESADPDRVPSGGMQAAVAWDMSYGRQRRMLHNSENLHLKDVPDGVFDFGRGVDLQDERAVLIFKFLNFRSRKLDPPETLLYASLSDFFGICST